MRFGSHPRMGRCRRLLSVLIASREKNEARRCGARSPTARLTRAEPSHSLLRVAPSHRDRKASTCLGPTLSRLSLPYGKFSHPARDRVVFNLRVPVGPICALPVVGADSSL